MSETSSTTTPQQTPKEPVSTANHLKLIKWEANSFAGLHESVMAGKSVVVFFDPESPIVGMEGDQGTGKTSSLNCLKALMGGDVVDNALNAQDGTIKASLTIQRGESTYVAKIGKNDFTLTETKDLPNGATSNAKVAQPKTVLKSLIGPIGGDPMFLKGLDGAGQINWLQQMFVLSPDVIQGKVEVERQITDNYKLRTEVNRDVKAYKTYLDKSKNYSWDAKTKRFETVPSWGMDKVKFSKDIADIERKLQDDLSSAQNRINEKRQVEGIIPSDQAKINQLISLTTSDEMWISSMNQQIIDRKESIAKRHKEVQLLESLIKRTQEELLNFEDVDQKYEAANKAIMDHGDYKLNKKQFLDDEANHQSWEKKNKESNELSNKLNTLEKVKMDFAKSITPDIEGLEVCVRKTIDTTAEAEAYAAEHPEAAHVDIAKHMDLLISEATREGIYYKGHSVSQMSESELFDLWIRLCKELKINVVFIENISSLGTSAIEAINAFADAGGHIFYSAMERGKSELKISFYNKIK